MSVSSHSPSDDALVPRVARLGLVGVVALSLGVLTAYAQEWLPAQLGSLANSSGSWSLVAFGLALLMATGARNAAVIGSLALLALLVDYVLGAEARGYVSGTALITFWGAAALLAGPLVGVAGLLGQVGRRVKAWARRRRDERRSHRGGSLRSRLPRRHGAQTVSRRRRSRSQSAL